MFNNNFTIITGEPRTGKSTALHELAYELKHAFGMKIAFLAATNEFEDHIRFLGDRYEIYRFLSYSEENDMKTLLLIEELCQRKKIDFVFIDDIESFFPSNEAAAKKYVSFIDKIAARKVAACCDDSSIPLPLYRFEKEMSDVKNYFISMEYKNGRSFANIDGQSAADFIKSIVRDEKIKKLLE